MAEALEQLDAVMERASRALAAMDYLACEALCLEALDAARSGARFSYYARVLLPLQEVRRQRRIIAAAGDVRLGSGAAGLDPGSWLTEHEAGCIVLTHPHSATDALGIYGRARDEKRYVEVLFADNAETDAAWTLRSYAGPGVSCSVPAPEAGDDPAKWFIAATERLGDAALAGVDDTLSGVSLVEALEARLRVFPDHELLHQRLAVAARAVRQT